MFQDCNSITTAPDLPATALADGCYKYMFYNCSSLNYIDAAFVTSPNVNYTYKWVENVASSGTFVKNPNATWPDIWSANCIPNGWTIITGNYDENREYTFDIGNDWGIMSDDMNPNADLYDGYYSYGNKGMDESSANAYLILNGYDSFRFYIRSWAENGWDYVMVSKPNVTIDWETPYNSTNVYAHTKNDGNTDDTSIDGYKLVEFTNLPANANIMVIYRKDGSQSYNDDCGYVLIPKNQ
jgi:hypothetical protein